MATTTVRLSPHTHQLLQDIANERDESISAALERVVEEARPARILRAANEAYAAIAADPVEDALWRAEIAAWDGTLLDDLEPESWDDEPEGTQPGIDPDRP
jgi:predicted transcriptional regulator